MTDGMAVIIIFIIIIILGIGSTVGILWMLNSSVNDLIEFRALKNFSKDLRDTVNHSQPTWGDIKRVAGTRELTQSQAYRIITKRY